MQIVLLNGLLAATGVNFIAGAPFEVYCGANCITEASLGATGAQFLLLESLFCILGQKLYYRSAFLGLQAPILLLGRPFEVCLLRCKIVLL